MSKIRACCFLTTSLSSLATCQERSTGRDPKCERLKKTHHAASNNGLRILVNVHEGEDLLHHRRHHRFASWPWERRRREDLLPIQCCQRNEFADHTNTPKLAGCQCPIVCERKHDDWGSRSKFLRRPKPPCFSLSWAFADHSRQRCAREVWVLERHCIHDSTIPQPIREG